MSSFALSSPPSPPLHILLLDKTRTTVSPAPSETSSPCLTPPAPRAPPRALPQPHPASREIAGMALRLAACFVPLSCLCERHPLASRSQSFTRSISCIVLIRAVYSHALSHALSHHTSIPFSDLLLSLFYFFFCPTAAHAARPPPPYRTRRCLVAVGFCSDHCVNPNYPFVVSPPPSNSTLASDTAPANSTCLIAGTRTSPAPGCRCVERGKRQHTNRVAAWWA